MFILTSHDVCRPRVGRIRKARHQALRRGQFHSHSPHRQHDRRDNQSAAVFPWTLLFLRFRQFETNGCSRLLPRAIHHWIHSQQQTPWWIIVSIHHYSPSLWMRHQNRIKLEDKAIGILSRKIPCRQQVKRDKTGRDSTRSLNATAKNKKYIVI